MINKPASETTALWAFILLLAAIACLTLAHGCNSVSYTEVVHPDGRVERSASAWYIFSESDATLKAKKGDTEIEYGRKQRVNTETLNKGIDLLRSIAEAAK